MVQNESLWSVWCTRSEPLVEAGPTKTTVATGLFKLEKLAPGCVRG